MFAGNDELREFYQIAAFERKEEAKKALVKEAKEVMKFPLEKRKKYYAQVINNQGEKAAKILINEVRNQRRMEQGMER